jgi:CRP-like cAMP-binding protein
MLLDQKYQKAMRANSLFEGLNNDDFLQVVENTKTRELKTDETLFRQQESATEFFFLLSGKIKLSLLSFDGTEKVVDIINEGNTFAEAVMFKGMPGYPVNAEALAESEVLCINAEFYTGILHNSPETCIKVMACLSIRSHWLMNELDRLSLHNATYRLVSYLLENIPEDTVESTEVNLSIPKHVVASRISVTPETFSRTLKRLSQQNLLEVHDSHIVLVNPVELRKIVSI